MMFATQVVLLQLLWLSLASARQFGGALVHFAPKKLDDGKLKVVIHNKITYTGCEYQQGTCIDGDCGQISSVRQGVIDSNSNSTGLSSGSWCQTETVVTRVLTTNKPFKTRENGCCWDSLYSPPQNPWFSVLTKVDLGTRSDTNAPNNSPATAMVSLLRAPQNCPRTYRPLFIDKDGDTVHCRYGNSYAGECVECRRQHGFQVNEAACTLEYLGYGNEEIYGFELMIEDYPHHTVVLSYSDGTTAVREGSLLHRGKRSDTGSLRGSRTSTAKPTTTTTTTKPPTTTTTKPTTTTTTTKPPIGPPTTTSTTTPSTTTTSPYYPTPLSKLPFQFLFKVDPPAPSCVEGKYIPKFIYPTPYHGDVITAEAEREVEIRVKAKAKISVVDNIMVSGPLNITKHRTTQGDFIIKWTPTFEDVGHLFPVCFVVEYKWGLFVYQTELRCVLVNVTSGVVKSVVTCTEDSMIVEVEKATLPALRFDHLQLLSDSSNTICSLQTYSNSTHVVAIVPLNRCGTQIEEDDVNLNFMNAITTEDDPSTVITRKHQLEVKFYCCYPKKGNVTTTFSSHRGLTEVFDKGFGTFTYSFEFYPNVVYSYRIDPGSYPLEYDVGDRVYSQIEATTTVNNTELFVLSCRASPYDNENSSPTYTLIENGCAVDPTLQIHPRDHPRDFRFSFTAFQFLDHSLQNYDQVFISCMVVMCEAGNKNSRCAEGCQPNGSQRWKREAVLESGTHYVSQGPLRRKRSVEAVGGSGLNLNFNLVFIAGCVLAVVGMICGVILYRAKKSTVKYQPLLSDEN